MADRELIEEISYMSKEGRLTTEDVNRLSLRAMMTILTRLESIDKKQDDFGERLKSIEDEKKRYPSLMELWAKDKKTALMYTIFYSGVGIIVFSPILIADIRQPMIEAILNILSGMLP